MVGLTLYLAIVLCPCRLWNRIIDSSGGTAERNR